MSANEFTNGHEANGANGDFPSLSGNTAAAAPQPDTSVGSGLSAAQRLQQAHEAQQAAPSVITEDPFPPFALTEDPFPVSTAFEAAGPAPSTRKAKALDVSDESAFPTLGGGSAGKKAATWGSGGGAAAQRIKQQDSLSTPSSRPATPSSAGGDDGFAARSSIISATVQLPTAEIHIQAPSASSGFAIGRGRGTFSNERQAEPTTLGEVMKLLMKRHPTVTVEASTSRLLTTFIIKSKGDNAEEKVAQVKRELLARLAKKVSIEVEVPAGLRGFIVGAKGRTLKSITDSTGANIQIPSRDSTADADEAQTDSEDLQDGPLIAITVSGDSTAVAAARAKILAIVSERVSKVQKQLETIPKEFWPLLNGAKGAKVAELVESVGATGTVNVFVPRAYEKRGLSASGEGEEERETVEKFVTVSGEREAVARVVQAIEAEVANLKRTTTSASIGINKSQHRFLVGAAGDEILEETGCSVELPPIDDTNENVTIRGPQAAIIGAFQIVMNKANATPIDTLDLTTAHAGSHDRKVYAASLTRYVLRKQKFRALSDENKTQVFLPRQSAIDAGTPLIEIVGKEGAASNIAGARQAIINIVRKLPPVNFAIVEVDSLIHRHLIGKKGKNIKAFEQQRSVEVVFPPDGEDRSDILLVFTGEGAAAEVLEEVKSEILSMAKEAADIKSITLTIPSSLHRNIIGASGTTLNAVIGEEKLVNVSFGSAKKGDSAKAGANEDEVVIRGPSDEVERVRKEIERIAEDAKNEEIVNSHVIEFEIDTIHVRHIVGKAGSGISKLRDDLGVRVDFEELGAAAAPAGGATKKRVGGKSKVTIKGRKENAEEARKRIQSQVTRIAHEVTVTIALPPALERGSLIGKQGTYLKRLEEKYEVRINFPRDGRKGGDDADEAPRAGNPNEITIRGGKKGADAARGELVALIAYEQENGNVVTFTVSVKSLPRILGKAGSQVNQIKEDTGVQSVDVDQQGDEATTATITLRGTKSGTKKAREAIEAIAKEVDEEARFTIQIPREYHTTLIGSGGSSIRELIAKAGGPTDSRASGNTVRFPRQGDGVENVTITAPKAVAEKIRAALEKEVESLRSRIVFGVAVAQSQHASIIGKGASAIQELQRKHGVKVTMPSWNEYSQAGEVVNPEDVKDAPPSDIIKIVGPREAAVAAAADLSKGRATAPSASQTIQVPKKFHAKIAQGGRFFRSLPSGTRVTHGGQKPPSSAIKSKKPPTPNGSSSPAGRIDDDGEQSEEASIEFQLVSLYDDEEENDDEEIAWVVESTSEENAQKVIQDIERSLELAKSATHVAWLTVPRGLMPRIVGRGGSGLDQLRSHGVEVEVVGKRDANQLTLTGTPAAIDAAHQQIVRLAAPRPPRQQRNYDDDRY